MEQMLLIVGVIVVGLFVIDLRAAHRQLTSEQVKRLMDNQKEAIRDAIKKKQKYPVKFEDLAEEYLKQMEEIVTVVDNPELYDLLKYLALYRVGQERFCEEVEVVDGPARGLKVERHHLWILPATK